jgi:predicted cobalt transporter CbtA
MPVFRTIIFVAAVAGAIAGFALTALQHLSTVPLIRQAETYEAKTPPTQGATEARDQDATSAHVHGWPADESSIPRSRTLSALSALACCSWR